MRLQLLPFALLVITHHITHAKVYLTAELTVVKAGSNGGSRSTTRPFTIHVDTDDNTEGAFPVPQQPMPAIPVPLGGKAGDGAGAAGATAPAPISPGDTSSPPTPAGPPTPPAPPLPPASDGTDDPASSVAQTAASGAGEGSGASPKASSSSWTSSPAAYEIGAGCLVPIAGLLVCGAVYSIRRKQQKDKLLKAGADGEGEAGSMHRMVTSASDEDDVDDGGEAGRDALLMEAAGGRIGDSNDDMEMYVQTRVVYPQRNAQDLESIKANLSAVLAEKGSAGGAAGGPGGYTRRLLSAWRPLGQKRDGAPAGQGGLGPGASPGGPQEMDELLSRDTTADHTTASSSASSTPAESPEGDTTAPSASASASAASSARGSVAGSVGGPEPAMLRQPTSIWRSRSVQLGDGEGEGDEEAPLTTEAEAPFDDAVLRV